jgi:uncharacterized membrane protein
MRTRGFLGGVAVGAGLVYFLDPERGEARRELVRRRWDKLFGEGVEEGIELASAEAGAAPNRFQEPATYRYGSRLGDISGLEAANLRSAGSRSSRSMLDLILGIAGGALALYGFTRRGAVASTMRSLGAGMVATSLRESRAAGGPPGRERRRTVDIQKTIHIEAPIEQVFSFWTNYENFSLFMSNIRQIEDLGGGRSRWVVSGPGGAPIEWDAVLTEQVPHDRIAWRSEPGSMLENAGVIRFRPEGRGTRVDLRLCYNPPVGGAGQAVAELLGADPRAKLNEDLGRLKALLEATVRSEPHEESQS